VEEDQVAFRIAADAEVEILEVHTDQVVVDMTLITITAPTISVLLLVYFEIVWKELAS
jgi:hypothetical protein